MKEPQLKNFDMEKMEPEDMKAVHINHAVCGIVEAYLHYAGGI